MPISAPRPRNDSQAGYSPSPDAAGLVSFLLPGLGQILGGEKRKGALFLLAHVINVSILLIMVFSPLLLKGLDQLGSENGMRINRQLSQSFVDLGIGSPSSVILGLLLLAFATFAARDAFDQSAKRKREAIYHDYVIAMPEAASGSYIFHISLLLTCLVLAFFFLIPPAPRSQVTDIEFIENQENTKEKVVAEKHATHNSQAGGKKDPARPVEKASASAASKSQQKARESKQKETTAPAQEKQAQQQKAEPREESRREPTKTTADITPRPQLPAPHPVNTQPQPRPAAPAPAATTPRPILPAITQPTSITGVNTPMPQLARPVVAISSFAPPAPVSPNAIAMGGAQPAMPRLPGPAASGAATSIPGAPAPVSVSGQKGGTTGSGDDPRPVPVKGSHSSGPGGGSHGDAPAPRGASSAPRFEAGGPPGAVLRPSLLPGKGTNTNGGGGPRKDDAEDVGADIDWGPYMAELQRRIKRSWYPPRVPETKRAKVVFKLGTNGELLNLHLVTSSGLAVVDNAALKAVENAAPFRPLPPHAPSSVDIEFTFDYNVFGGGSIR